MSWTKIIKLFIWQNIRRKKVDNIGEQKTKGKYKKIEEKKQQRKSLLKNTGAVDTSNKNKSKIQEERKERKRFNLKKKMPINQTHLKKEKKYSRFI